MIKCVKTSLLTSLSSSKELTKSPYTLLDPFEVLIEVPFEVPFDAQKHDIVSQRVPKNIYIGIVHIDLNLKRKLKLIIVPKMYHIQKD